MKLNIFVCINIRKKQIQTLYLNSLNNKYIYVK